MPKRAYIGVDDAARRVKKLYIGVDGTARKVKKGYIGVGGVAHLFFMNSPTGSSLTYHSAPTTLTNKTDQNNAGTIPNAYAVFFGGADGASSAWTFADAYNESLTKRSITLTKGKKFGACASTTNYCVFAGGVNSGSAQVPTYCLDKDLSVTEVAYSSGAFYCTQSPSGTSLGSGAFFCGGSLGGAGKDTAGMITDDLTTVVFNTLSVARTEGAAANINKRYALYAGGYGTAPSDVVDCYDSDGTRQTLTALSVARNRHSGASKDNAAFFAGGYGTAFSNRVDIYDEELTRTTGSNLSTAKYLMGSGSFDYGVVFAGGHKGTGTTKAATDCNFYDMNHTRTSITGLTAVHGWCGATTIGDKFIVGGGQSQMTANGLTYKTNLVKAFLYKEEY